MIINSVIAIIFLVLFLIMLVSLTILIIIMVQNDDTSKKISVDISPENDEYSQMHTMVYVEPPKLNTDTTNVTNIGTNIPDTTITQNRIYIYVVMKNEWKICLDQILLSVKKYDKLENVYLLTSSTYEGAYRENIASESLALDILRKDDYEGYVMFAKVDVSEISSEAYYLEQYQNCMLYFMIERYELCHRLLKVVDTVGINFQYSPDPHYIGNFWWANAEYIRTLPEVGADPNIWIGMSKPTAVSLWQTGVNHAITAYPASVYKNHPIRPLCTRPIDLHI